MLSNGRDGYAAEVFIYKRANSECGPGAYAEKGHGRPDRAGAGGGAGKLGKPIFGLFENMRQVRAAVIERADGIYQQRLREDMQKGEYPPYKAGGMSYIRFAVEESELFKLLFMRDRTGETPARRRSLSR